MEYHQILKQQVKEILSKQVSDYLPTVDEADYETSLLTPSLVSYNTQNPYNSNNFDLNSSIDLFEFDTVPLAAAYDDNLFRDIKKFRSARVFSIDEASKYMRNTESMNQKLWEAVENNLVEEVRKMIQGPSEAKPEIDSPGLNRWNALHMAAARGFYEICEIFIDCKEECNVDARTSMNRTALHLAVIHNSAKVAGLLIKGGAQVDLIDNDFNTALHYASMQGYDDIVEILLKNNARIDIKNNLNRTPNDVALNFDTYSIFVEFAEYSKSYLQVTPYSRNVFCESLRHNSREDQVNKMLLKSKVLPNKTDLKLFNERPTLEKTRAVKKILQFKLPESKVSPYDFKAILQLGKGSFGSVYLVEKKDTREKFALKILDKEKIIQRKLERYAFTERNILMKINHPFIVKLHYAFQTPEKLALVMDYCSNGDLASILSREKVLKESTARFYLAEIILGLQELHKHNIIFRDLKPDNILIDDQGHIKITDFGLSKEGMSSGKLAHSFCGSAAYFAPEMIRRQGHTRSIDWYVLGAILYEMLTGSPPYYSTHRESLYKKILQGKLDYKDYLSEDAVDLIRKLLKKDPKKRLGAGKKDAEEVMAHEFFKGVNWDEVMEKKLEAPFVKNVLRVPKAISMEKIYGKLNEKDLEVKTIINGWSVLEKSK